MRSRVDARNRTKIPARIARILSRSICYVLARILFKTLNRKQIYVEFPRLRVLKKPLHLYHAIDSSVPSETLIFFYNLPNLVEID